MEQGYALTPPQPLAATLAAGLAPREHEALNHPVRRCILRTLHDDPEPHSLAELTLAIPDVGIDVISYHLRFLEGRGNVSVAPPQRGDTATTWRYVSNISDHRHVVSVLHATEPLDG